MYVCGTSHIVKLVKVGLPISNVYFVGMWSRFIEAHISIRGGNDVRLLITFIIEHMFI